MSSPEEQQPPSDRPWPDPEDVIVMSEEDQRIFQSIIDGTGRPVLRDIDPEIQRSLRDGQRDFAAYLLRTRQEMSSELQEFASRDGNLTLNIDELRDYLTSTASNGAYDGETRRFYGMARDLQAAVKLQRPNAADTLEVLMTELYSTVLLSDIALDSRLVQDIPQMLRSTALPPINTDVAKGR